MGKRFVFKAVNLTAILIFVVFYLQILTGLVAVKGESASWLTLGLVSDNFAYSFHSSWAPALLVLLFLAHGVAGLGVWIRRRKSLQGKRWPEIAAIAVGLLLAVQLLLLYLA